MTPHATHDPNVRKDLLLSAILALGAGACIFFSFSILWVARSRDGYASDEHNRENALRDCHWHILLRLRFADMKSHQTVLSALRSPSEVGAQHGHCQRKWCRKRKSGSRITACFRINSYPRKLYFFLRCSISVLAFIQIVGYNCQPVASAHELERSTVLAVL